MKKTRQYYENQIKDLTSQLNDKDLQIKKLQSELQTMIEMWSRVVRGSKDQKPVKVEQQNTKTLPAFGGHVEINSTGGA